MTEYSADALTFYKVRNSTVGTAPFRGIFAPTKQAHTSISVKTFNGQHCHYEKNCIRFNPIRFGNRFTYSIEEPKIPISTASLLAQSL